MEKYHSKTVELKDLDSFLQTLPREGVHYGAHVEHFAIHGSWATVIYLVSDFRNLLPKQDEPG